MNPSDSDASRFKSATTDRRGEQDLDDLLVHVARGDTEAFEALYDRLFGPVMGGAATWVMIIAHRRAIDRVRSTTAAAGREHKTAEVHTPHDEVAEAVEASLDRERVRRCLEGLTEVQRESITLAYYGGYSYRQVSDLLKVTLGAIKTRIRDGLIRMRDCLGVS